VTSNFQANKLVTVVMPTWNCAAYLPASIEAILAQDWPDIELIVVDDGSTDDTAAVLARYGDRLRTITIPQSGGPSRPRNIAIEAARGDFVAFCDADDLMKPGKLRRAMELFAANPDMDLLSTSFRVTAEDGHEAHADFLADYVSFRRDLRPTADPKLGLIRGEQAYGHLLHINFIGTSSVVCRRGVFATAGGFAEELRNSNDIDMWRRIAWHGHVIGFLDEVWHTYQLRSSSICARGAECTPYLILAYERQLPYLRTDEERRWVRHELAHLHLGYASHLRHVGRADEAIRAYTKSLRLRLSAVALVGLVRARLQHSWHHGRHAAKDAVAGKR